MRLLVVLSLGIATALLSSPAECTTWVVTPEGDGDFPTIQAAISSDFVVNGDIIELTDGVYQGPGNRDISFVLKPLTVRSQSGNPAACLIDCEGTEDTPHRGFEINGSDRILEGVTVMNGFHVWGGGIAVNGSPTIRNCILRNNEAPGDAGGMYVGGGWALVEDCLFVGNHSAYGGGGIAAEMMMDGWPTIRNCTFVNNTAASSGGGVRY